MRLLRGGNYYLLLFALFTTSLALLDFTNSAFAEAELLPKSGTLKAENSGGRHGKYFLPANYKSKRLPLMVVLHGSNIDGSSMLKLFKSLAKKEEFIIVAPDSVNTFGWVLTNDFQAPSEDQTHIYNAINEVLAIPKVRVKSNKVLIAGISAGGSVATFLGSNDTFFSNMADLHGGVRISTLGTNLIPVWLSTGTLDELRPPSELQGYETALNALNFPSVVYKEYPVPHQIANKEKKDLINWWLAQ